MSEIILINLTGADRPGITRDLSGILARHDLRVLDIGQAVIHDTLTLGLLEGCGTAHPNAPILGVPNRDSVWRIQLCRNRSWTTSRD